MHREGGIMRGRVARSTRRAHNTGVLGKATEKRWVRHRVVASVRIPDIGGSNPPPAIVDMRGE